MAVALGLWAIAYRQLGYFRVDFRTVPRDRAHQVIHTVRQGDPHMSRVRLTLRLADIPQALLDIERLRRGGAPTGSAAADALQRAVATARRSIRDPALAGRWRRSIAAGPPPGPALGDECRHPPMPDAQGRGRGLRG